MRFGVLGAIEVRTERGDPVRVPELKVRLLLAHLLLRGGEPISADQLTDQLWGEQPPSDPRGALQAKVSQLRRALGDAEPNGRDLVVTDPAGYRLRLGELALDSDRFTDLLSRARAESTPRARVSLLDEALALWRGPAFADVAEAPAAQPVIGRLTEQRLTALEDRAEALLELGEHLTVAGELAQLAAEHPLRERLRATQMRALYRSGRANEALTVFDELRRRLRTELGADPGPELADLHRDLLEHSPRLRPPVTEPARPRVALPTPLTELIGRAADSARVRALFDRHRLVTLTGIGGVGKTRLALAVALELDGRRRDGARFVELDRLPTTGTESGAAAVAAVAEVICAAVGVKAVASAAAAPTADPVAMLTEFARDFHGVLVLDNCEHVIGSVATLVAGLLAAAPAASVLATSREPLSLAGEALHPVPPLPADGSAVELFAARAVAADPDFVLDASTEADVRTICLRLDGIPLALELAAASVRSLGVAELSARLDDRFRVLSARRPGVPARQQTLRATIDWSWALLTESERIVLRRFSVFAGGTTMAAAEYVCGDVDDRAPARHPDRRSRRGEVAPGPATHQAGAEVGVAEVIAGLVDRSLVVRGSDRRFRMLESVSAYAAERLADAGEAERIRGRHVEFHLTLAESADVHLRSQEQRAWLAALDAEDPNMRAALCAASADQGLRLVSALSWYWFLRGRPGIAIDAADAVLAEPGGDDHLRAEVRVWRTGLALWSRAETAAADHGAAALAAVSPDSPHRARAHWLMSFAHWGFGDVAVPLAWAETALAGFRAAGDDWGSAAVLAIRASYALLRDDLDGARRDAHRADELFTALGDRWGRVQALDTLAGVAEVAGEYGEAIRRQTTGLRMAEDLALWPEIAGRLSGLGRVVMLTGDLDASTDLHERARRLALDQGNIALVGFAEFGLALTARRRGDLDTAERILLTWLTEDHPKSFAALTPLAELGFLADMRGDGPAAHEKHAEAHRLALATGAAPRALALTLEGLAGAHSLLGEPATAARLLGAADAARRTVGAPLPPAERFDVDRITARARTALGASAFDVEYAEGAATSR
ncbi:BTAD domain-containing putative transcriptional regulator [Nocardia sp. NPDC058176]|uniref:BTAD domain-containing putative transcriptional regulator n=1 Tax=Nocardia sp. NPDC058176 TaxID=3346368 RepID=UPI0036DCBCD5